jgi:hypothetical protein
MKWPVLKCPFCNATLDNNKVRAGKPLVCPSCSAELQPSSRQIYVGELVAIAIAICIGYWFGLRGLWLFVASILMWFPIAFLWMFVIDRIRPPKFELYDPYPSSPFKEPDFVTLFPREDTDGDKPKKTNRTEDEPPKDS